MPETARVVAGGATVEYTIVRSTARKKTIALAVLAGGEVVVRSPLRVPGPELAAFVEARVPWLLRQMEREKARPDAPGPPGDGQVVHYGGWALTLRVEVAAKRSVRVVGDSLVVAGPGLSDAAVERALGRWYVERAGDAVTVAVARWASAVGREPATVSIRDQKRRWGSCSTDGSIRINWRCVAFPPEVLNYVVVHELCHLVHHNHSALFWAEVARVMPGYREHRKALKTPAAGYPFA
jgi:predicted metal-dependent hydrolase